MSSLPGLLAGWLPAQRWFAGSGTRVSDVTITSDVQLADGEPELRHLIVDVGRDCDKASYQVLAGVRTAPPPGLGPAAIGTLADGRTAYDAAADPELMSVLADGIAAGRQVGPVRFASIPGAVTAQVAPARLLPAATSNTSVIFGDKAILKLLRRPFEGHHPDLEIPAALAANGSALVAAPLGWLDMDGTVLAILSEYLPNSGDGWSLATASLNPPDAGFSRQAHDLGEVTGRLHAELATAFGTRQLTSGELSAMAGAMAAELTEAVAIVPGLGQHAAAIQACYEQLAEQADPVTVQRVHGDYHLAQVLRTSRGWVILDFEGEPSVPLARRRAFAPALRDVCGMLRSFDYAARHQLLTSGGDGQQAAVAAGWVSRCQDAFCAGYASAAGADPREYGPLLRALTFSKAVYEAVYEARHRPDWLSIPLAALADARRGGTQ